MEIINDTPFNFGYIAGRIPFPGHSLTLIVKATFDLIPDGVATISENQLETTGDEFFDDDEEMIGGPRYASDFAYIKPRADMALIGHCHAPKGTLAAARRVTFGAGDVVDSLIVYGDRHWVGPIATDPEPFSKMPLRYEYSYGGRGFKKNPSGRGYGKQDDDHGEAKRYLPNILRPGEQLATPLSKLEPAGFGPINREWPQRQSKLGSYRGQYLKTRWPWFAENMDWRYFNASPETLQTDFFRGDESLYFENLHAQHTEYRSTLPGHKIRCFVKRNTDLTEQVEPFSEVDMRLDTLWADMDNEKVVLVWRGWCPVITEEFEDIQHILIASESVTQKPEGRQYYENLMLQRLNDEKEHWEEAPPPAEPAPQVAGDIDKLVAGAEASYRQSMCDAGLDPENPPRPSAEDKEKEKRILEELGVAQWGAPSPEMSREKVLAALNVKKDLSRINLEKLDLSGIDFSGANLEGTLLSRANLSGARFTGANLTGCVLEKANLRGADLHGAVLVNTDLTAADLSGADLCRARMTDAIFDRARMADARIDNVEAGGASFIEADLSGSRFVDSVLCGADFSMSNLERVRFTGADLTEASIEGARGPGVVMDGADLTELKASEKCILTGGSFRQVSAKESIWQEADLSGSDFSFSKLEGACFSKATLVGTRFRAVDMKNSRFDRANLTDADLALGNFLESSFERSNLTRCDCRQSNMYGSEFLNAVMDNTRLDGTNLKMTKLADQ